MKRLTKSQLAELGIRNEHNLWGFTGAEVFIYYSPWNSASRATSGWRVQGKQSTEPDGPWYNHGTKTFVTFGRDDKAKKLEEAMLWCSSKYKIYNWERDPFGAWHDREYFLPAMERLASQYKKLKAEAKGV